MSLNIKPNTFQCLGYNETKMILAQHLKDPRTFSEYSLTQVATPQGNRHF